MEFKKTMEILDVCNEDGFPTGKTVSRAIAHRDGILHRTAHVWVVRKNAQGYDILLQKRSMEKDSFPGLYDTSSAGHIPAGEEPVDIEDLALQKEEVEEVRWFDLEEVYREIQTSRERFCVPSRGLQVLREYLVNGT